MKIKLDKITQKFVLEIVEKGIEKATADGYAQGLAAREAQLKELERQRDILIRSTPCPRCKTTGLFVCSMGALNCGECGDTVAWAEVEAALVEKME